MADNGYLTPRIQGEADDGRYAGYYKVSRDGFQCDGTGKPDYKRLDKVLKLTGQKFRPSWRESASDSHVLICPPIVEYERVHHFAHTHWLRWVQKELQTSRFHHPVRVRYKPGDKRHTGDVVSLAEDFKNCHAVITVDSKIAVEAVLEGIPCYVTGTSPVQVFGNVDIQSIEMPRRKGNRRKWLAILANNQWTLDEIRAGMALGLTDKTGIRYENRRTP